MLVFVTSIRNPLNCNNFERIEKLLEATLHSACSQTDGEFRVVVVCNAIPKIGYHDPRISFHLVDFPPPSLKRQAETGMSAVVRDKGTKILAGMLYARRFQPDYFGILDADDLLSKNLVAFVKSQ